MSDYWFGPKRVGVGLRPQNWKGWLTLLLFVGVVVALSLWLLPQNNVTAFVIGLVISVVVFFVIALLKRQPSSDKS